MVRSPTTFETNLVYPVCCLLVGDTIDSCDRPNVTCFFVFYSTSNYMYTNYTHIDALSWKMRTFPHKKTLALPSNRSFLPGDWSTLSFNSLHHLLSELLFFEAKRQKYIRINKWTTFKWNITITNCPNCRDKYQHVVSIKSL